MQRNRQKQWTGKYQKYFQENWRYQGNISFNKGQKWYGPITEAEDSKERW